jgi:hypothetical protein
VLLKSRSVSEGNRGVANRPWRQIRKVDSESCLRTFISRPRAFALHHYHDSGIDRPSWSDPEHPSAMQKLVRIEAQFQRNAVKRAKVVSNRKAKKKDKEYWAYKQYHDKDVASRHAAERKTRREDWIAGPLAPDRDTGKQRGSLGALNSQAQKVVTRPRIEMKKPGPETGLREFLVVDDRVVVVKGPHMGQIGNVMKVDREDGNVTVKGLNIVSMALLGRRWWLTVEA